MKSMDDFCDYLMDWLQQEDQPLPSMYTRLVQQAVMDHKKKNSDGEVAPVLSPLDYFATVRTVGAIDNFVHI